MTMKSFDQRVYELISRIPAGRVSTYAAVAAAIGCPRGSRAVGNALNRNPFAPRVPCHRIIRSDGALGGFAFGSAKKAFLLSQEGIVIAKGKIDLNRYRHVFKLKR